MGGWSFFGHGHSQKTANMSMRDYYQSMRGMKMGSRAKGRAVAAEATRRIRENRLAAARSAKIYKRPLQSSGELKFIDVDLSAPGSIANTYEMVNLCTIPQGDTESNRIGRKVTVKKINIELFPTGVSEAAVGSTSGSVKILLVLDTQTNGAAWTATDLMETDSIYSFANLANNQRFRILKSKVMTFSSGGMVATGAAYASSEIAKYLRWSVKCNIPIEYDNSLTTGVISTVRTNSLWLAAVGTDTGHVSFAGRARIRFVDGN